MSTPEVNLFPIGWVRSSLKDLANCPHWQDSGPEADLEILPEYVPALDGMQPGQKIVLLTWLHLAARNVLHRKKHQAPGDPPRGVFSSRSPVRPNPIGLHDVTVKFIERRSDGSALVRVNALEALDGTPVVDIKTSREFFFGEDQSAMQDGRKRLLDLCHIAAAKGGFPGCSGNASLRMGSFMLITPSGKPKESLKEDDLVTVRLDNGKAAHLNLKASSEYSMHLEIYRHQPEAMFVLHTHPAALSALSLRLPGKSLSQRLDLPLFECAVLREKTDTVANYAPGSIELAKAVAASAVNKKKLVWLEAHGLCAWGGSASEVLSLSQECEHLAKIALLASFA